jgi:hypothetical protein
MIRATEPASAARDNAEAGLMTIRRFATLLLAILGAQFLGYTAVGVAGGPWQFQGAAGFFGMAMAAWLAEREWIHEHLLLGRSFATWFFGTLAIAVAVGWMTWRFGSS